MASTYLSRATSDPQSSNTTATFSVWIKRSALGSDQTFWGGSYYSTDNMFILKFVSVCIIFFPIIYYYLPSFSEITVQVFFLEIGLHSIIATFSPWLNFLFS